MACACPPKAGEPSPAGFSSLACFSADFASWSLPRASRAQDFRYQAFSSLVSMASAAFAAARAVRFKLSLSAAAALFLLRSRRSFAIGPLCVTGARATSLRPCQKCQKALSWRPSSNAATPSCRSSRPTFSSGAAMVLSQPSVAGSGKGSRSFHVHFSEVAAFSRSPASKSVLSDSMSWSRLLSSKPSRKDFPFAMASRPAS
mmetsp:Transcript_112730/g.319320  ORF Transcript_112730/g.319320 Transcript_112730/m.319320 type:complete len:202 (-) Transcript_112730:331-936(-)